jgi:hypothetical protein
MSIPFLQPIEHYNAIHSPDRAPQGDPLRAGERMPPAETRPRSRASEPCTADRPALERAPSANDAPAEGASKVRSGWQLILVTVTCLVGTACDSKKDDAAAYEACIAHAKKSGSKFASAEIATLDKVKINSLQDGTVAVIIPIKMGGKDAVYECNAQKQQDNTFKVNYTN